MPITPEDPNVSVRHRSGCGRWSVQTYSGIVIPSRNVAGRVRNGGGMTLSPTRHWASSPASPHHSSCRVRQDVRADSQGTHPPAFSPFCRIRESNTVHAPMAARLAAEGGGQLVNSCSWLPFACKGMASCVCEGLISDPGQSEGPCGGFVRTEAATEINPSGESSGYEEPALL